MIKRPCQASKEKRRNGKGDFEDGNSYGLNVIEYYFLTDLPKKFCFLLKFYLL
jgi:hypothetical protein